MRSRSILSGGILTTWLLMAIAGCGGAGSGSASMVPGSRGANAAQRISELSVGTSTTATKLFSDYFETGSTAGWTPLYDSHWSVCQPPGRSHEYCTPGRSVREDALATAGSMHWTNYEVDAWTVPGSAVLGGVELVGRYVDEQHFYQLELRNLAGGRFWGISKKSGTTWTQLAGGPLDYVAGGYYHLRFILDGPTLTAYATTRANDFTRTSEVKLGSVTDFAYSAGAIAVRAVDGIAARFDNIDVVPMTPAVGVQAPPANPNLMLATGFYAEAIATVSHARELVAASNGDLLIGTTSAAIVVVPDAESDGTAGSPQTLITLPETPAEGIALGPNGTLYAGTKTSIWQIPYTPGTLKAPSARKIAAIRSGPVSPASDGDVHTSTSVIVSGATLYAGIGSSCDACTEVDPTRASVQAMKLDGSDMHTYATRIRNPIAFTTDPVSGAVFTGGAGQDGLTAGHPYEYLDALTAHAAVADYGWPACEENHVAYTLGSDCAKTVQPAIEFPAYSTIVGSAYYPAAATGTYVFPASFRSGIFVSMHGSWHATGGIPIDGPHVAFVPMNGDVPAKPVDWHNPTAQWTEFFSNFQYANGMRIGRTSGIAVGPRGSLFVADDQAGVIYRIRPGVRP